jgi:hypothetical protein
MPSVLGRCLPTAVAVTLLAGASAPALAQAQAVTDPAATETDQAQRIADLQRQIDELKAIVAALQVAQTIGQATALAVAAPPTAPAADQSPAPVTAAAPLLAQVSAAPTAEEAPQVTVATAPPSSKKWYDRLVLRGYTQMRMNQIVSGPATAPPGTSRLRTVGDGDVRDNNNFSFRRVRLILQGDINEYVSLYLQPDFATAVSNQAVGERREGFGQLRDAYADVFPTGDKAFRIRLGQSKVPYGWENMQSSSNRLALDRTDAINSAAPGERDLGIVAYYTPPKVQKIWNRLLVDGQKLFGNYGAFGLGVFNGQGLNRTETNDGVMTVALATWPFELDGLGLDGQIFEMGGAVMRNRFSPEVRTGGFSPESIADNRVGIHAILYPQPFGLQSEWNWGTGPEFDPATGRIEERPLNGGYIQAMARVRSSPLGPLYPFIRWQYYRGGFKHAINAPRLETEELELGIEFLPTPPLEITLTYGRASRKEADERRFGQAQGEMVRVQAQWNY